MLTELEKETFEQEKIANSLSDDWLMVDTDYYIYKPTWWESFSVMESDGVWLICQYDHDAGIDANGESTTSCDIWDTPYPTWISAAKEVEK